VIVRDTIGTASFTLRRQDSDTDEYYNYRTKTVFGLSDNNILILLDMIGSEFCTQRENRHNYPHLLTRPSSMADRKEE